MSSAGRIFSSPGKVNDSEPPTNLRGKRMRTNQFTLKSILVSVLVLFSSAVVLPAQKQALSQEQAVKLAEEFIAQNGYTDLRADKSKLAYETIEGESNVDDILRQRRDTLERKAYGIVHGRKSGVPGWTVVFRYRHPASKQERRNGRAVTMNLDGSGLRVEHLDFILKYVERKL